MPQPICQRLRQGLPVCSVYAELAAKDALILAMAERIQAAHAVIAACAERRNDDAMKTALAALVAARDTSAGRVAGR
jgi:hypothetical protein